MQSEEGDDHLLFTELTSWRLWQKARVPVTRRFRTAIARRHAHTLSPITASIWGDVCHGVVVVALDSLSPSQIPALIEPARYLIAAGISVAIITDSASTEHLAKLVGTAASSKVTVNAQPSSRWRIHSVLSAGDHMPIGELTRNWARDERVPYIVVQHGILTPFAPPLPPESHLLAWSAHDHRYWSTGHAHLGDIVGSQLLWNAAQATFASNPPITEEVTFLGQLHGAELPRRSTRFTITELLKGRGVTYRPHPSERDISSNLQHWIWRRRGVRIELNEPLSSARGDVLSHFSTGLLETASMGGKSFGYCTATPRWLLQLWERYEIATWGDQLPTQVHIPKEEPAKKVARYVQGIVK